MSGPWEDFQSTDGPWNDFAPQVSTSEDLKKTALPSLARAAIGTAGLPGDIGAAMSSAGSMIGLSPSTKSTIGNIAGMLPVVSGFAKGPTSPELTALTEKATGPLYQPQTPIGKIADTAAQMAPALFGGPESLGAKLLTRVGAPALGAEAAGALTNDNPYAKTAAAVAASALAHRAITPKAIPRELPVADPAEAAARQYEELTSGAIAKPIPQKELDSLITDIQQTVAKRGAPPPSQAGEAHNAIERINPSAGRQPTLVEKKVALEGPGYQIVDEIPHAQGDIADLVRARQNFNAILRDPNAGPNKVVAGIAKDKIDAALTRLSPETMAALRTADKNYKVGKQLDVLQGRQDLGELNTKTAYAGQNANNANRQAYKALIRPNIKGVTPAERFGFSEPAQAAINQVARGTTTGNTARYIGKLAPTDLVKMAIHGAAAGHTMGMTLPLSLGALGAKKIGEISTQRAIQRLEDLVRSESPEGQLVARALQSRLGTAPANTALPGGLLAALMAARQQPAGLLSSLVSPQ